MKSLLSIFYSQNSREESSIVYSQGSEEDVPTFYSLFSFLFKLEESHSLFSTNFLRWHFQTMEIIGRRLQIVQETKINKFYR